MLWTILVLILALWLVGWLTLEAAGGLIHVLLVVAAIILLWHLLAGRRAV